MVGSKHKVLVDNVKELQKKNMTDQFELQKKGLENIEDEMRIKSGEIALLGKMKEEMLVLYCVIEHVLW